MLRKHVEIWWKCLKKVKFISEHKEHGFRNWKKEISTFQISHALGNDILKTVLNENNFPRISEISKKLNSTQQIILDHIRKLGFVWTYLWWMPHEFREKNLNDDYHMHSPACKLQNRIFLEPENNYRWKADYLRKQEKGILSPRKIRRFHP